jgi:GT2 family glycosyltransferase
MADRPDVSIVITTYNGWDLTKKCLASLVDSAKSSALSAEIIISDNCSTDDTPHAWQDFQNGRWPVRYRRNHENLGYLRNANAGAAEARGTFLCLMNNDVIVQPGWLDGLVQVLRDEEQIGLVGPKYLDAKDEVIEVGLSIFRDGTATQLGHGTDLSDPEFSYINDVHYCSMACAVVRADLFRELGGYDETYAPAYYEDADLCMRITEKGRRVVVNPGVVVKHLFGGSHSAEESRRLMDKNRALFVARWKDRLNSTHAAPGAALVRLRTLPRKPALVFHFPASVNPNSTTGAQRTWHLMLEARKRGHHVIYVGQDEPGEQSHLAVLRRQGVEVRKHRIGAERRLVQQLVAASTVEAAIMSFAIAENAYGYLYDQCDPRVVRVFDTVDLNFLRELRADERQLSHGGLQDTKFDRLPDAAYEEIASMLRSDVVLVVSEEEKRVLVGQLHLPPEKIHIVSTIHSVAQAIVPYAERKGFSFIGYGGHLPNVDAIEYMVSAIWPRIRQQLPAANLVIFGFGLPQKVQALHDPGRGIVIYGYVEDHLAALGSSRVMLAPLRFGAGVKGKIGEALGVGTPVVTTPTGAEGIDSEGTVLAVETRPERIADRAVEIYRNEDQWLRASRAGMELLEKRFSKTEAINRLMHGIETGRQARGDDTAWRHVALAAMAQQKIRDNPKDIALRAGYRLTHFLYRLRGIRNPTVQAMIRFARSLGKPK